MSQRATGYSGQGFSLRGEKGRFVLPPAFRNPIAAASDERVLCIGKHDRWPCLTGFGSDRKDTFEDLLDGLEDKAIRRGEDFDREMRSLSLWTFTEVSFDASGRFIMTPTLSELGEIGETMYFHGAGPFITIWNPAILLDLGPGFEQLQTYCRSEMADAEAKGKGPKRRGRK